MVVILQQAKDESEEREQFVQTGGPEGRGGERGEGTVVPFRRT